LCEECLTIGSASAYVVHPLNEEGSSVVHTLQPINGLEVVDTPIRGLVVILKVEAIGNGAAQGRSLRHFVARPLDMKVFKWSLLSLGHLDDDEGDNLIRKTVPNAAGSHPLRRVHGVALWGSGRESNACMDEI
jgi:hypothetical protein